MSIISVSYLGLFFGLIGTLLGGIIGIIINIDSDKEISFILQLSAGIMISISCFELIPEAMNLSNINIVLLGIILGITMMEMCNRKIANIGNKNPFLKTGLIIAVRNCISQYSRRTCHWKRIWKF